MCGGILLKRVNTSSGNLLFSAQYSCEICGDNVELLIVVDEVEQVIVPICRECDHQGETGALPPDDLAKWTRLVSGTR